MRMTRRRKRKPDPFASPEWVRSVFDELKVAFPLLSSLKEKDLIRLARAVRHVERYSASDTRRGRPSRWPREDVVKIGANLASMLQRETSGNMSVATFVDHYLRILDFPSDVLEALKNRKVNLFEAEQLARITSKRLNTDRQEASRKRTEILKTHLQSRSSGERLRRRINELINPVLERVSSDVVDNQGEMEQDLENFDPYDPSHLFWEEIKNLGFAFKEIRREDLTDELLEELLQASQPIWAVIAKIQRRKRQLQRERMIL